MSIGLEILNARVRPRGRNLPGRNFNACHPDALRRGCDLAGQDSNTAANFQDTVAGTNLKEFNESSIREPVEKLEPLLLSGIRAVDIAAHCARIAE
jgi:hypothetical protein